MHKPGAAVTQRRGSEGIDERHKMANIKQIDKSKPLEFRGDRIRISNDPELIRLTQKTDKSQMLRVSEPVTDTVELSAIDAKPLLEYLARSAWSSEFNTNLQSLSETQSGAPLLTGWMGVAQFREFTQYAGYGANVEARSAIRRLHDATHDWIATGVELVYFEGCVSASNSVDAAQHQAS